MCALALLFLLPSPWSPCPFFSQGASLLNRIGASTSTPRRRLDLSSGGPKPWASGAWRSDGRLSMGSGTVFLSARARASIGQTRRCVDAPQCHPNADADRRMQTVLTHRLRLQAGVRACLARLAHGVARAHGRALGPAVLAPDHPVSPRHHPRSPPISVRPVHKYSPAYHRDTIETQRG